MKYEIEGTIVRTEDGLYNVLGHDGELILPNGYRSLRKLLMDLAKNLNENKIQEPSNLRKLTEELRKVIEE